MSLRKNRESATYLRLTPRWHKLNSHPEQCRAWNSRARFNTIHAGRRGGKTEIFGKRKPVLWLWDCYVNRRIWNDPRRFIAAPTWKQVKDIYWNHVKALVPREWIAKISEENLSIVTKWNAELCLVSLDKPARIEGQPWDAGTIDEYADTKPGTFDAHIRPAIADRLGSVDFLGVPDMDGPAQVEYEEMCLRGQRGDQEWDDFCWGSEGILPPSEIESMRRTMDPRMFVQETTGKFILRNGRAFPDFDAAIHVGSVAYDPALPICWSLDFNINPMCSGVIQHYKGEVRILKELVLPDTKTDAAITAFLSAAKERGWKLDNVTIYGDASGSARDSTSGVSDWYIVRNRLRELLGDRFSMRVPRANPGIKDTINAVNAKLMAADGTVSLRIDPSCVTLLDNFRTALWPSPNDLADEHCLAWLRYFVDKEYPIIPMRNMITRIGTAA